MRIPLARWFTVVAPLIAIFGAMQIVVAAQHDSTPEASNNQAQVGETPIVADVPSFAISAVGEHRNQWFEVTIEPGDTIQLTAGIQNYRDLPVELHTFAADAVNLPNGGFSAASREDEPTGATLWIDYPEGTFTLQSGSERQIDFTVTVPNDTPPGEYFAGLVVETTESWEIPGSQTFRQVIRSAISVEITVPGDMTSGFELGEPTVSPAGDRWALDTPITNTGTARLRPQGDLVVTTPDGKEMSTAQVKMGSFYGGNTTSVRVTLPGQVPSGDYLVSLNLTDEATGATASLSDIPVTFANDGETPGFVIDEATMTPNGEPVQYADVAATITNNGSAIPTANVTLNVQRDGEVVESYPLAQNQALPQDTTDFSQRYIPVDGWQPGTYTFELVISAVSGGTETILATVEIPDEIVVP